MDDQAIAWLKALANLKRAAEYTQMGVCERGVTGGMFARAYDTLDEAMIEMRELMDSI